MNNFIKHKLENYELNKTDLLLPFFGMLFISANIGTNIFALRFISFSFFDLNFVAGGGIFIFPITFFTLDTVTEYYGFRKSLLLIIFNIFVLLFISITFWYTLKIPPNNQVIDNIHYNLVMTPFFRAFFATACSGIIGYILNCFILEKLKYYLNSRFMILRLIFATSIAEIIYSIVWNLIDMGGQTSISILSQVIGSNFVLKVFFQTLSTPFTYLIVKFLRNIDDTGSFKIENPFLNINKVGD